MKKVSAWLCVFGMCSCGALPAGLIGNDEEQPLDADESYLSSAGPQAGVDLGDGGEQLLSRYQRVLQERMDLDQRLEDLETERRQLESTARHEREAKERERGLRVGAEAQREHLVAQLAERDAKILALNLERAKLEQEVLRLRIVSIERELAELNAAAAEPGGGH